LRQGSAKPWTRVRFPPPPPGICAVQRPITNRVTSCMPACRGAWQSTWQSLGGRDARTRQGPDRTARHDVPVGRIRRCRREGQVALAARDGHRVAPDAQKRLAQLVAAVDAGHAGATSKVRLADLVDAWW